MKTSSVLLTLTIASAGLLPLAAPAQEEQERADSITATKQRLGSEVNRQNGGGRRMTSDEATVMWPPRGGHLWPPSGAISEFPRHVTDKNVHNQGVIVVICGRISK